eukprot:jgi/Astpho2/7477/Aster-02050
MRPTPAQSPAAFLATLSHVHLNNCKLTAVAEEDGSGESPLQQCWSVQKLYLYENRLTVISGLTGLSQLTHLYLQTATLEQAHLADDVPSDRMAHACLQAGHTTGLHSLEQLHHDCLLSDSVAWPAHPQETVPEKANTSTNGARPSLALQNNYITSLHGLEQLHSLQKLYLEGNSLARIEHLGALRRLCELHVSRQLLPEGQGVEFDGSCLQVSEVSVVHPAQQGSPCDSEAQLLQLTSIRRPAHTQKGATCLVLALSASLKVLSAAQCGLQAVAGLAVLGLLQALDLSSNAISDAGQVPKVLTGCQHLRSLSLQGNPICKQTTYRWGLGSQAVKAQHCGCQ